MGQATYSSCLDAKKSRLWSLSLSKCARFSRKTCVRKTEIVQTSSLTARLITSALNGFLSLVSRSLSLVNRLPPLVFRLIGRGRLSRVFDDCVLYTVYASTHHASLFFILHSLSSYARLAALTATIFHIPRPIAWAELCQPFGPKCQQLKAIL